MSGLHVIPLATTCVLSQRWPVAPFKGQFCEPRDISRPVFYEVDFSHRPYLISPQDNLTVIKFQHSFPFNGTTDEFAKWGRDKGGGKIARHIILLVNTLIDLAQGTFEKSEGNPFPHIRRVGMADFVSMDSLCGENRQNLISFASPGLTWNSARRSEGMISKINFAQEDDPPNVKLKLIRAVELVNTGYYTEGLLVSFALLDYSVNEYLIGLLNQRGVHNSEKFLEAIPSNRLATYLGPLLKVLTCHSLEEDRPPLWERLKRLNTIRNDAMHRSKEIEYKPAREGIETVRDIMMYLSELPNANVLSDLGPSGLGINRLPFLL